ncbi:MAG: winged helix-turn-helix domain-containing protein [Nitrosopumilus sp.]|jgi:predicted transcriptional regulator
MKTKRSKLQIYFDVITAILSEKQDQAEVSKTRLQHKSNTSYDKLLKYLDEMSEKGLINLENEIDATELGIKFHQDYSTVNELIDEITQRLS